MGDETAIAVQGLTHRYGDRVALDGVDLTVRRAEIFGLLGPNGGGKTTLFRVLATLVRAQEGSVRICGLDAGAEGHRVRGRIGVVFQKPSVDPKLTAGENLVYQGLLYGLSGATLKARVADGLERMRLTDREHDRVETLSGGLQRRVELAKALIHRPEILVFDEPSTGLDPGARRVLWEDLERLRSEDGVTVILTTHFLEEAEKCDRIAILSDGKVIAVGAPDELKGRVGGDVITITGEDPEGLRTAAAEASGRVVERVDDAVRLAAPDVDDLLPTLYARLQGQIRTLSVGRPTLEDVFIKLTGRRFETGGGDDEGA